MWTASISEDISVVLIKKKIRKSKQEISYTPSQTSSIAKKVF